MKENLAMFLPLHDADSEMLGGTFFATLRGKDLCID